jgi:hypothetical protein
MGRRNSTTLADWNVTSPAPRPAWQAVVDADPTTFVYQTPAGLDALCVEHGAADASRLYEFDNGQQLVLPMYRTAAALGPLAVEKTSKSGSILSSQPLRPEELSTVSADLAGRPVLRTLVRSSPLRPPEVWAALGSSATGSTVRTVHILDLDGGFDHVAQHRFNAQARRAIRRAERSSIDVQWEHGTALLPAFRQLWEQSVERWSGQAARTSRVYRWRAGRRDPTHRLSVLAETMGTAFTIWLARVDGRPAASIVVLQDGNAHYTNGAMDIDLAGPTRASFLLQKMAIEQACAAGCRSYHFGETGQNAGLARFKSQFGAQAYRLPDYHFERVPITAVTSRGRELARRLIRR